jgi:hypothetical protein
VDNLSPYNPYMHPMPVMSHQAWERQVAQLQELHRLEEAAKEKLAREAAPPPPRVPRTMDEAYVLLLRGHHVEAALLGRLIREDDEAQRKASLAEAQRRREAEWPIGDWGCSYQGGE